MSTGIPFESTLTNGVNLPGATSAHIKGDGVPTDDLCFPAADVKHFIGGIYIDITEDQIRAHFERFGAVKEVEIMRDNLTNRSRGFGFVTMAEPSSKPRIAAEKEHIVSGRAITVRPYAEASELRRGFSDSNVLRRKIFVGGVNPALGQEVLDNYFSKYGPLDDAQIIKYPDGKSRGFGFVVFKDESACQQVLQQPSHNVTARDRVEVRACLSRSKALRQQAYASSHAGYAMGAYEGGAYDGGAYGGGAYGGGGGGASNYGASYGQQGAYGAYSSPYGGSSAAWQGAEYQTAEGGPYQAAYDSSFGGYYGWGGYSPQGVAAAGGPRSSTPIAAGAAAIGRDQYSHDATARGMTTSANPYAGAKGAPTRPSTALGSQMAGNPMYNPVRRAGLGPAAAVPVGYGAARRPGPY